MNVGSAAALSIHAIAESLYAAGALAICSVAWHAPHGAYRLRPTLVSCLCLALALLTLLHLLVYPGMPNLFGIDAPTAAFCFARLGRALLCCAIAAWILVPRDAPLTATLRWSLLATTLAVVLPVVWLICVRPDILPAVARPDGNPTPLSNIIHWALVDCFLVVSWLAARMDGTRALLAAALLGVLAEALHIPGREWTGSLDLLGHAAGILSVAAVFYAIHDETIVRQHTLARQERAAAHHVAERADAVFRAIADGIVVVDAELRVLDLNPVASHLLGVSTDTARGLTLAMLLHDIPALDGAALVRAANACLHGATPAPGTPADMAVGSAIESALSPLTDREGHPVGAIVMLRDASDQQRLRHQMAEAADYARSLVEANPDPMIVIAPNGMLTDINRAAEEACGLPRAALIGGDFARRFSDPAHARRVLRDALASLPARNLALELVHPGGGTVQTSCSIVPYRDATGAIRGAIAVARNTTDMRQAELQMRFQADYDALTTLPNRRHFRERIGHALEQARRTGHLLAVIMADLDDFKDINDTLGHAMGDALLKKIGARLADALHATDTVARVGGDEFGVLVADLEDAERLRRIIDKLGSAIAMPMAIAGREICVTCSIGVSVFPLDPGDAETLLRNADTAMFRAKGNGKNNCQYFTADMNTAVQRRVAIAHHLRHALRRDELSLHYQPQVDLASGAVVGVEALLRWHCGELGRVAPQEFIPVAEDTGQILAIGAWVVATACHQAAAWRAATGRDLKVAVNLSARQFRDDQIVATIASALYKSGLPPQLLELELTESMLMRDTGRATETMMRLKNLGTRIAIDDFGTGYSSLSYLKHFPLDYLKIDRSFVMETPGDANDVAIVRSIVALAHGLGLRVIAEGVETAGQMDFLAALGCEEVQGYHVSPPLPADALSAFLAAWPAAEKSALAARCPSLPTAFPTACSPTAA